MPKRQTPGPEKIAVLGSLPPLRALSSYCLEFSLSVADITKVEFISFKRIYPSLLYPGGDLKTDRTFPSITHPNVKVRRRLTWYNPLTWIIEGVFTRAELLHAQWWSLPLSLIYAVVCGCFKLRGKPVIFTVHNTQAHEKSFLFGAISRGLFKLGDHFFVHSTPDRDRMLNYYKIPPEKVTQIPHGPLDFHTISSEDRSKARKEIGFHPEDRVILLFGAIRPYKGIDTALNAFAKVLRSVPEARLLIAGKPWESWEAYDRMTDELNIRDYVKTCLEYIPSDEVWKFFRAADLVILPYHHFNAQSGVGATAVSFRKPMIVTSVGGLPDLAGNKRYVVPPKDPEALAGAIIDCLKDPEKLADMAARTEELAKKIAWPAIGKKTWSIYRRVLGLDEDNCS